jgi:hypothetical protein
MNNITRTLSDYYYRKDFRQFQNNLALEIYNFLETSYSNSDGEIKMVTGMCDTLNGKTFDKLSFHTKKIHGTTSFVEFYNQNKLTTRELADMVIISVITNDKKIIFEKTAFIQNKKEEKENIWKIEQDQLYLLQNFPTFKVDKGILKKNFSEEIVFQNHSGTLGNYGLFQSPGEMILINAMTIFKLQQSDKISFSDIKKYANADIKSDRYYSPLFEHFLWDEIYHKYFRYFPFYGFQFLDNRIISFNIYEFIRNWSLFNIGEVASVYGHIVDKDLNRFNQILLCNAGLRDFISDSLTQEEYNFDNNLIIMVAHLDLSENK